MQSRNRGEFPEDASHYVVTRKRIVVTESGGDDDRPASTPTKVYEAGEELPPELAEECWFAFGDRIAAFDGNGQRQDVDAGSNVPEGVRKWQQG